MGVFIVDDIISENGFTASTSVMSIVNSQSVSATTFHGNGSNLTNLTNVQTQLGSDIPNKAVLYNNNGTLSGSSKFIYSGDSLFFTGVTRFNGLFYLTNSPSVKAVYQWAGNISANSATPGVIWGNMPAGTTTWLNTTNGGITNDATYVTDLTEYTECRLFTSLGLAAFSSAILTVQYATSIAGAYSTLVSIPLSGATGPKDSGWVGIASGANNFVYIRLVGAGGNGIEDPRFSPPTLLIR